MANNEIDWCCFKCGRFFETYKQLKEHADDEHNGNYYNDEVEEIVNF